MLEVKNLQKKFGTREALKDVSFSLAPGEIYGLLGPNGAGKTTTLKILAGLLAPDGGSVIVAGQAYHREHHELKRSIAYVPDQPFLYYKLSGEEHLHFYMDLYKIPYARRREKVDFFFKYFEFEEYRTELVENYSAGTRQKLLISQALAVEPRLLLLDEPLVSIDPLVGRKFKLYLGEVARQGTAILFATHILTLAQEVCRRIGIIVDGRIIVQGGLEELMSLAGQSSLEEFYFQTVLHHEKPAQA
ncbi:MAG: ABC transporter ATP-binding protein [Acidobacteria bacterium]|jgi:ABC-2 type transport system ATP-binding protein|nr:ABC transporter ATP-binding protein [Acidobacteriota bacterium]